MLRAPFLPEQLQCDARPLQLAMDGRPIGQRARLACMKHFLSSLDYPLKDRAVAREPDPLIVGSSAHVIGTSEHILGKSLHPNQRRGGK